jgi:two-component system, cell cycle response regulator
MTQLVHAALTFRKGVRASFGYLAACALGLLDLLGVFRDARAFNTEHAVVLVAWLAVFAQRAHSRIRDERRAPGESWFDLEQGLLLLTAAHAVIQAFGGLRSPLYPVLYVLVAFASSFSERRTGRLLVLFAVAFEAPLYFVTEAARDPKPFVLHAIFLTLFGLINVIFTQAELTRVRIRGHREREDEKRRVQDDARLFRLASTPTEAAERDDDKLFRGSVEEVHQALFFNLALLKRTLGLHSAVLLLRDENADKLRIVEMVTDSDDVRDGPFAPGEGAVGACYQRGLVMNLEHLRPGYSGLCYYRGDVAVRSFIAVPVREGGLVVGALCADRLDDRPFTPAEEQTLAGAVEHLLRALENERVFVQLERSKREHTVLYQASQALGAALTEHAVLDAALSAAAQIVPYDFAAATHYDQETAQHSVRRAVGEGAEQLSNLSFRDNASLTAMAVQNRHYLPYRGDFDAHSQIVYTRNTNLDGMCSLLILPLCVRDAPIGTLALAAKRRDAFGRDVRPALQLLANQMAVALSNAASVARLEQLATTDGLTGCYNKRYFTEELKQRLQAAQRFGRKLSLVITDIDHFKVVNDTYGHHIGDVVIKELGAILRRLKRETDVVARFGGEEFCILCEETDTKGAIQLAERVRQELADTVFETDLGKLKVTCSLGVATFPAHAQERQTLFSAADKALYAAKHAGRNRVVSAG